MYARTRTHMRKHTHTCAQAHTSARTHAHTHVQTGSWDRVIGIVTKLRAGKLGWDKRFMQKYRPTLGPSLPPFQRVPGALSPGVKRPRREAGHAPPSNSLLKNRWSYTYKPPCALMTCGGTLISASHTRAHVCVRVNTSMIAKLVTQHRSVEDLSVCLSIYLYLFSLSLSLSRYCKSSLTYLLL